MIERAGEGDFDYALHEGSPDTRIQWYFHDRTRLPVAVQSWTLAPGGREGMHAHGEGRPLEELYVVVEGSAVMRVDDVEYRLGPGDAVLAPPGAQHDVRNTGEGSLRLLVVWGPPGEVDFSAFGSYRAAAAAWAARPATHPGV
ncbi:cupin domain-containing protein [Streptomyces cavernicola]|uniref:Cupin domain-containing protein n=1 Tax=Streptomyces cavernicola TaxID=3043613 RepID=A0ABT6SBT2_9ACTN|nr:cupin domain-containing protein [Streptomyces sp. B-S-A6]MDI3405651.1 cupin domain-containing protein [Streptomyces sp. B-S-A6]